MKKEMNMNAKLLSLLMLLGLLKLDSQAFYNAKQGRWQSRDPIEESGGANVYGFVGNEPNSYYDRLGLDSTNGRENDVERVTIPPQVQHSFGFDEKYLLASQLKELCPRKAMTTSWNSCCNPQNCKAEADRLAEYIVKRVRENQTFYSRWVGNATFTRKEGRGCQNWANIVENAYDEATYSPNQKRISSTKADCFLAGHIVYSALYDTPHPADLLAGTGPILGGIALGRRLFIRHHWVKIFSPEFKVATNYNHMSLGIDIDAWQTGGASIYPIKKYRADYIEKLHGAR